jgi:hypothetical protein
LLDSGAAGRIIALPDEQRPYSVSLRAKGRREVGTVGRLRVPCGRVGGGRAVSLLLGEANRVSLTDKQQRATSRPAASRARAAPGERLGQPLVRPPVGVGLPPLPNPLKHGSTASAHRHALP